MYLGIKVWEIKNKVKDKSINKNTEIYNKL